VADDPAFQALSRAAQELDPAALGPAVERALAARASAFLDGVVRYREHRYRRDLEDPPVLWREGPTRLLDYAPASSGRPVLFVPSLINRAYILDLMPGQSLLRWLVEQGLRPLLLDWGTPGAEERRFTLTDYICGRLERALDALLAERLARDQSRKPLLAGYCMGGMLALALAERRQAELGGLVLMATPWDFHAGGQEANSRRLAQTLVAFAPAMELLGELPLDAIQALFAALDPLLALRKFQAFARMEEGSARATAFVALEDWLNDGTGLAAPVAREALGGWYGENTAARGQWRVAGRVVEPARVTLPSLALIPEGDRIVPPASALALANALPNRQIERPPLGHIGMVVSGQAKEKVWQVLRTWCAGR
jgi:polyhydroxyalkanoate synthase